MFTGGKGAVQHGRGVEQVAEDGRTVGKRKFFHARHLAVVMVVVENPIGRGSDGEEHLRGTVYVSRQERRQRFDAGTSYGRA